MGIPVARIELVNALQMRAMKNYSQARLSREPVPVRRIPRQRCGVAEQAETFGEIAEDNGGGPFLWTTDRRGAHPTVEGPARCLLGSLTLRPGAKGLSTDVCVPISRLAECVAETEADIAEMGLIAPIVGHAGDGNFHVLVLMDVERSRGDRAGGEIRRAAQHARHRHGRHLHRRAWHRPGQDRLHATPSSAHGVDIMRTIKQALDPQNILNPGKIFDTVINAGWCLRQDRRM